MKGFSLAEVLITTTIVMSVAAMAIPSYRTYARRQAARSAAGILESACQLQKQNASALAAFGGICLGQSAYRLYQYNPFSNSAFFIATKDLQQTIGTPLFLVASASSSSPNPCASDETNLAFSPGAGSGLDWQGTITVSAGEESWKLTSQNGVWNDGP